MLIFDPMHISFRRLYLDQMLAAENFSGLVLDVGGKKSNPRGNFRPPSGPSVQWKYLSIDASTQPDFHCSAEKIPVDSAQFDVILLSEVAEHLENPEVVLAECARVLKTGAKIIMTMPFLYGVHADPHDFQRWTPNKIEKELLKAGFEKIQIAPMGGALAVFCDLHEMWCFLHFDKSGKVPVFLKITRALIRRVFLPVLKTLDRNFPFKNDLTTGYYVRALRK